MIEKNSGYRLMLVSSPLALLKKDAIGGRRFVGILFSRETFTVDRAPLNLIVKIFSSGFLLSSKGLKKECKITVHTAHYRAYKICECVDSQV